MALLIPFVLLFGLLFLMNRGEKKKRAQLESKLKKGDKVVTRAGIIGKLTEVSDTRVRVEIAPGVNVSMLKASIEGLEGGDASAKDGKSAASTKDKSPPQGGKKK